MATQEKDIVEPYRLIHSPPDFFKSIINKSIINGDLSLILNFFKLKGLLTTPYPIHPQSIVVAMGIKLRSSIAPGKGSDTAALLIPACCSSDRA